MELSPGLVTKISEKIMPEVAAWQNRPLEAVYPFLLMDAIHYKVREDHRQGSLCGAGHHRGRPEGHPEGLDWGA